GGSGAHGRPRCETVDRDGGDAGPSGTAHLVGGRFGQSGDRGRGRTGERRGHARTRLRVPWPRCVPETDGLRNGPSGPRRCVARIKPRCKSADFVPSGSPPDQVACGLARPWPTFAKTSGRPEARASDGSRAPVATPKT